LTASGRLPDSNAPFPYSFFKLIIDVYEGNLACGNAANERYIDCHICGRSIYL